MSREGQIMELADSVEIQCPYCWERIVIEIDPSVREQDYIEDCQVCCRPIEIQVRIDDQGDAEVGARREDE